MLITVGVGECNVHLFSLFSAKVEDIAHFSTLNLPQLILVDAKFFNGIIENFFIDGNVFLSVHIENIFTRFTYSLEFMTKLREGTTTSKSHICFVTYAESFEHPLVGFDNLVVVGIQVFGRSM